MNPIASAAVTLCALLLALMIVNVVLYVTSKKRDEVAGTFKGLRPPHCDPTLTDTQAALPTPLVAQSTGYDWVAANFVLNLFQEGARAYAMNQQPVPFPRTSTVAVISGKNVPDPKTVAGQRLKNIVWVVKAKGQQGRPDLIFVVFRGTQSNPEWMVDATIPLKPWHPDYPGVQVHEGFNNAIMEVRDELYAALSKSITQPDNTVVYVTGLSLGGGLSTVTTADLLTRSTLKLKDVRLYAFSAPRVGNQAFVDMMKALAQKGYADIYTIVNQQDAIPTLPPNALGYAPMPQLTFNANWGDPTNNHLSAVQLAHIDRVYQKCPAVTPYPDLPV